MNSFFRPLYSTIGLFALALGLTSCGTTHSVGTGPSFKGPVGLQLYSLRDQFGTNVTSTLNMVRALGFKYVELYSTHGLTPEKFRAELDARGLKAIGSHFPYERFRDDPEGIARDAKILGLQYVGCAWIPHEGDFDEATCRAAIAVFNKAGETLARHGLQFFYHTHGYEFRPVGPGTLFDRMMSETKPEFVSYEMDVFWVVHAGHDPVKLFEKYSTRWILTHLKDMKASTPTGLFTGQSPVTNDVPLGTGKIDMAALLRAAGKVGVKWHFIEDESPTVEQQLPQSLRYLETVKW